MSAVPSQFPIIERVAALVKELDPDIFVILGGGHHASLSPDQAIEYPNLDAICVSEGDSAVVQLASQQEEGKQPAAIPNLWIRHPETREIEKNPLLPSMKTLTPSHMSTVLCGNPGLPIYMKKLPYWLGVGVPTSALIAQTML